MWLAKNLPWMLAVVACLGFAVSIWSIVDTMRRHRK